MTKKQILLRIKQHTDRIAKERDALRELIDEATAIMDSCEQAEENLQAAADALSQYL
jgi:ABC-type transporter Mla subunit MlaD